jgi:hypothetical protein
MATLPPKYKALLLGISYSLHTEDSEPGSRPTPLESPLNDTEEMKAILIGGA